MGDGMVSGGVGIQPSSITHRLTDNAIELPDFCSHPERKVATDLPGLQVQIVLQQSIGWK
eukprot:11212450-Karenia_brevis.AAC.1